MDGRDGPSIYFNQVRIQPDSLSEDVSVVIPRLGAIRARGVDHLRRWSSDILSQFSARNGLIRGMWWTRNRSRVKRERGEGDFRVREGFGKI